MDRGQAEHVLTRLRGLKAPTGKRIPRPQPRPAAQRARSPAGQPMDRGQADHVLGRIRELLAQQKTLEQTGEAVGLSKSGVHYIAVKHKFRRRTKLSPERRAKILADLRAAQTTQAELARRHKVAKSTINDYANRISDEGADEGLEVRGLKAARRCPNPECGQLIKIWPCVACAARLANQKPNRPSLGAA